MASKAPANDGHSHPRGHMGILTWLRRSLFAASALLTALALVAPMVDAQEDPDASRPPSWGASAATFGVHVELNTDPPQTVPEIIRFDLPHGESRFGSGFVSDARAASLWPGLTVAKGANLLWGQMCANGFPCDQFPGFPPQWPLAAESEYPTRIDTEAQANGQSGGDGPLSYTMHVVKSHAGRDHVSSEAVIEDLSFLEQSGAPQDTPLAVGGDEASPALVRVGTLTSTTREEFEGDVVVARAESRLQDVSLFGGALHIEQIIARSTSRSDGSDVLENEPLVRLEGVTLNGQSAEITSDGILVDGEPVDDGTVSLLRTSLGALSEGDVRVVSATDEVEGNTASAEVTGLLVSFRLDTGVTALVGDVLLGSAATQARIGAPGGEAGDFDLDLGGFDEFPQDFADTAGGTGDGGDFTSVAGSEEAAAELPEGRSAPVAQPARSQPTTQSRSFPLEVLSGLAADRMTLFYLAWSAGMVALALGSRARGIRLGPNR